MRIGGVILARLDSSRFPRKHFHPVRGKPMFHWLLERVGFIRGLDDVIVATSDRPVDDELEAFSRREGVACFRGDAHDVANRVLHCITTRAYDAWARINGDSPLLDFELYSRAIRIFREDRYDIVTNVFERSFPVGNSVEIIATEVFRSGCRDMSNLGHREHVTPYFYENVARFKIHNIQHSAGNVSQLSLAIDTIDDMRRYVWIMDQIEGKHLSLVGDAAIRLALEFQRNVT